MTTKPPQFIPSSKDRRKQAAESQRELFHAAPTSIAAKAVKAAENNLIKGKW